MTARPLPPNPQPEIEFSLSLLRIASLGEQTEEILELELLSNSVSNVHVLPAR